MVEIDFERRLERLFAEAPELPDARGFAERVEARLDRGWNVRRLMIGAAGIGGGIIGASQLMMSNMLQGDVFKQMESAGSSARVLTGGLSQVAVTSRPEWMEALTAGGSIVWIASGLAILAMAFVLTRVVEEL